MQHLMVAHFKKKVNWFKKKKGKKIVSGPSKTFRKNIKQFEKRKNYNI